jgi:hypothetical protein
VSDENWWWLSFTDPNRDNKLLGVAVGEGDSFMDATQKAIEHNCHPGGDVQILPLTSLREAGLTRDYTYILLSETDVRNAGFNPDEAAGTWMREPKND